MFLLLDAIDLTRNQIITLHITEIGSISISIVKLKRLENMGFFETLEEMVKQTTGGLGGFAGTLVSVPHASITALVCAIEGKDGGAAAQEVIDWYAEQGISIGRNNSTAIVRYLMEANRSK
jgi:hypothetical protein